MINIRVETLYKERVGIRDKYIEEAQKTRQGLIITHGQDRMIIPWLDLERLIVARSGQRFVDRYGKNPHYLIYYDWKPEIRQGMLI